MPKVAFLLSVYNEEKTIAKKIDNILSSSLDGIDLEILIGSDGSTDRTDEIIESSNEKNVKFYRFEGRNGKNKILNMLIDKTDAEFFIFSDTNAMFDKNAIKELIFPFTDDAVGCVVGEENRVSNEGQIVADGLYWRIEKKIKILQNVFERVLVANGPIMSLRASCYEPLESYIANDFQSAMDCKIKKKKVIYNSKALAYEPIVTRDKEEFSRKVRIVNRGMNGFLKYWNKIPVIDLAFLISFKFLRWLALIPQILLFGLSVIMYKKNELVLVVLILQIIFYTLAVLGLKIKKIPFNFPFYLTYINIAAFWGSLKALFGLKQSLWEKAKSNRK